MTEEQNIKIDSDKLQTDNNYEVKIFSSTEIDKVNKIVDSGKVENIIDTFSEQVIELSEIKNPQIVANKFELKKWEPLSKSEIDYVWVHYPWKRSLVKLLKKEDYKSVRHSRNRNLITQQEQEDFQKSRIAIAGLNVGHPGALCISLEGGANNLKLADFDELSVANLNRFRAGVCELGMNKAILAARQILEIDPFYEIEMFDKGISPENIEDFLLRPRVDLLIEETDNLNLKIKLREIAKKEKIPVLMVTGNGSGLIIDIERYDLEEPENIMNGYLGKEVIDRVKNVAPGKTRFEDLMRLLRDFMGKEYLSERLVNSFPEVGKTIAGIPQLSESSFLRGAALCYYARKITTGENVPSGRYSFQMSSLEKL